MKKRDRTDERIAQVFASLRDVESPTGMEQRVLDALKSRKAVSVNWIGRAMAWRDGIGLGGWIAFTTTGILVALLLLTKSTTQPFSHAQQKNPSIPAVAHESPTRALRHEEHKGSVAVGEGRPELHHVALGSHGGAHSRQDLAAQEASAPSMTSPPMPLTNEEKLLQQAARRGRPEANSPLNPEVRARERLQAALDFTDFFTPPAAAGTE